MDKHLLKTDKSKMKKRYIIETECKDIIEMINVQVKCGRAKLIPANRALEKGLDELMTNNVKYIKNRDNVWHPMDAEMPPTSTKVDLLKDDGSIIIGEIIVAPSGFYIYLNPGWVSTKDFTHWRFRPELPKR